jgi:hypothetical protein
LDWIHQAEGSGIRMLKQFARTLRCHAQGILAYYDYPISIGPLEGTNNKIKTMKRFILKHGDTEQRRKPLDQSDYPTVFSVPRVSM